MLEFPWHLVKFPDNSLTFRKFISPWHFPDGYEPWGCFSDHCSALLLGDILMLGINSLVPVGCFSDHCSALLLWDIVMLGINSLVPVGCFSDHCSALLLGDILMPGINSLTPVGCFSDHCSALLLGDILMPGINSLTPVGCFSDHCSALLLGDILMLGINSLVPVGCFSDHCSALLLWDILMLGINSLTPGMFGLIDRLIAINIISTQKGRILNSWHKPWESTSHQWLRGNHWSHIELWPFLFSRNPEQTVEQFLNSMKLCISLAFPVQLPPRIK